MLETLPSGIFDADGRPISADIHTIALSVERSLWAPVLKKIRIWIGFALASVVVGFYLAGVGLVLESMSRSENPVGVFAALVGAAVFLGLGGLLFLVAMSLKPTQNLSSITKVYWGGLKLPLEGKVALYDLSGVFPSRQVATQRLPDLSPLAEEGKNLDKLSAPSTAFATASETMELDGETYFGREAKLGGILTRLRGSLASCERDTVEVTAVPPDHPLSIWIAESGAAMGHANVGPIAPGDVSVEDTLGKVNEALAGIYRSSRDGGSMDIDALLSALEEKLEAVDNRLSTFLDESLDVIQDTQSRAIVSSAWQSNAYYCSFCNESTDQEHVELVAASRLHADLDRDNLVCDLCHQEQPQTLPLNLSRFEDELFRPLYDQILLSLRSEILAIDRSIENELLELNKERQVENQKSSMSIGQERRKRIARVRELDSQADALKAKVIGTTTALRKYKKIAEEDARGFREDAERLEREIQERTRQQIKDLRSEFERMDREAKAQRQKIETIAHEEEERKHGELIAGLHRVAQAQMLTDVQKSEMQEALGPVGVIADKLGVSKRQRHWRAADRALGES